VVCAFRLWVQARGCSSYWTGSPSSPPLATRNPQGAQKGAKLNSRTFGERLTALSHALPPVETSKLRVWNPHSHLCYQAPIVSFISWARLHRIGYGHLQSVQNKTEPAFLSGGQFSPPPSPQNGHVWMLRSPTRKVTALQGSCWPDAPFSAPLQSPQRPLLFLARKSSVGYSAGSPILRGGMLTSSKGSALWSHRGRSLPWYVALLSRRQGSQALRRDKRIMNVFTLVYVKEWESSTDATR